LLVEQLSKVISDFGKSARFVPIEPMAQSKTSTSAFRQACEGFDRRLSGYPVNNILQGAHPKVVQERLGHSSIKTTLDVYGHL